MDELEAGRLDYVEGPAPEGGTFLTLDEGEG